MACAGFWWGNLKERDQLGIPGVDGRIIVNPLNAELNPICHLLALLGAHHILHVTRIRVKMEFQEVGSGGYGLDRAGSG